ncbi:hypothetical protein ACMA1D_05225 [Streptomyces sp. 796.1]|uniref:hypothetical protein n=1 Tax=Streptomyces sp. 796.1 TaxID=3163029 RepID=UPI0039C931C1
MEAGHVLRALRAAVFAAVCVLLAAAGHAVMSATPIPLWALGLALAGTGGAAWCAGGRERGPVLIMSLTVGAQLALHTFFSAAQTGVGGHGAHGAHAHGAGGAMSGHGAAGASAALREQIAASGRVWPPSCGPSDQLAAGASPTGGNRLGVGQQMTDLGQDVITSAHTMALHDGHGGLGMWSAHLVVALVCGAWLCGGEQAAFRVGRALAGWLFAPLYVLFGDTAPGPLPEHGRRGRAHEAHRPRRLLLVHVIATRGPPRPAVV